MAVDPDASSESFFGPFVMCSADDGSCVEVGEDGPQGGGGPHMFNDGMDTVVLWASAIVSTQNELPDLLPASPEDGDPDPLSTLCMDERGLVVITLPSLATGVVPTAPSSPGTDPDAMYNVLVAAEPSPAGESLSDAQVSGRFELSFVPGGEVAPGALSSTEGLDGVATRDIAEGEQITEDSFG